MTVNYRLRVALLVAAVVGLVGLVMPAAPSAQSGPAAKVVTFTKDIAPILQRSCQTCHRPDSVAPMSLITYEEVRPWAKAIKTRTGLRGARGSMPPWFVERNIGIQQFKGDDSLSEEEILTVAKWVDNGAPRGNPADMPPSRDFSNADNTWTIKPDLVVRSDDIFVPAVAPDRWGSIGTVPTGLKEDRYVQALEVREVNDLPKGGSTATVGGRTVWHHMRYTTEVPDENGDLSEAQLSDDLASDGTSWPTHNAGRNADIFSADAGRLLKANSVISLRSAHIHSNGRDTNAHLEFAFKFFPKGYEAAYPQANIGMGNPEPDTDVQPNTAGQQMHGYAVLNQNVKIITYEPHMHATGVRQCLEAIWGSTIVQLNCVAYDHNWVTVYPYAEGAEPLLPKGTILHLISWLDTSPANKNPTDNRNWLGYGRRSIASMAHQSGYSVALTDEQFEAEMAKRRAKLKGKNDWDIGCLLCQAPALAKTPQTPAKPVAQTPQTPAKQGN